MKAFIKRYTPELVLILRRNIAETISSVMCYAYDFKRYMRGSSTYNSHSQERMLGKLVLYYHVIEKGLSFKNRKPSFGLEVMSSLIDTVNDYVDANYDKNQLQFRTACSVIKQYFEANDHDCADVHSLRDRLRSDLSEYSQALLGGSRVITKQAIQEATSFDFKLFFNSRHSIREFSKQEVEVEKVLYALDIARNYPSVCNRQAIRIYLITSKDSIARHLKYQNGNRGFGERINKLIVVTSDLSVFSRAEERNQPFIDGGIYLMGLLLALHGTGLGAVPLNWSTHSKSDRAYRKFSNISDNELIISFVGIGHLQDEMTTPKSERNPIDDIVTVIR